MITNLLDDHGIIYYVSLYRVIARDDFTQDGEPVSTWVDLTNYSNNQLGNWLGYDVDPEYSKVYYDIYHKSI